jgi:hypothetical protein
MTIADDAATNWKAAQANPLDAAAPWVADWNDKSKHNARQIKRLAAGLEDCMISKNYLLSQLGVPYDDCQTTADFDQRFADALTILAALAAGTYRTPGFVQQPLTMAAFDPANVAANQAAMVAYRAAEQTGNLATVHAAVDNLNAWRTKGDGAEFVPPSDFDLLQHAVTSAGALARKLASMSPVPMLISDPQKANGIVQAGEVAIPAPVPPVTPVIAAPAMVVLAAGTVIPASDGSKWTFFPTPFGNILVKAAAGLLAVFSLFGGAARIL